VDAPHNAVLLQAGDVAVDVPDEDSEEERPSPGPSPRRWLHTKHAAPRHQASAGKSPSLQLPGRTKSCSQVDVQRPCSACTGAHSWNVNVAFETRSDCAPKAWTSLLLAHCFRRMPRRVRAVCMLFCPHSDMASSLKES